MKFVLANTINLSPNKKLAGAILDDVSDNLAPVLAGGGYLIQQGDAVVDPIQSLAQTAQTLKGTNEQDLTNLMVASVLNSIDKKCKGTHPSQLQNTWHISKANGDDNNTGKTSSKALKTFKELQNRLGFGTLINPAGGTLSIFVHGTTDYAIGDPLTLTNTLATGCRIAIKGDSKVLGTGTISAVDTQNKATNQPWTITDVSKNWNNFIGKVIHIKTGAGADSIAYVVKNLGGGKAMVSEWMGGPQEFLYYAPPPAATSTYEILDYTKFYIGNFNVGMQILQGTQPDWPGFVGAVNIETCHFKNNAEFVSLGTSQAFKNVRLVNCISDAFALMSMPIADVTNCCFATGLEFAQGTSGTLFSGCVNFLAADSPADVGYGGVVCDIGANLSIGGNFMAMGSMSVGGNGADIIAAGGKIRMGSTSLWDCVHGLNLQEGNGEILMQDDPLDGTADQIPLWGNGNTDLIYMGVGTKLRMDIVTFGAISTTNWTNSGKLPTYLGNAAANPDVPAGVNITMANATLAPGFNADNFTALAWDNTLKSYKATSLNMTWAKIDVGTDTSGFKSYTSTTGTGQKVHASMLHRPEQASFFNATLTVFAP